MLLSFAKEWEKVRERVSKNKPLQRSIGQIILDGKEDLSVICSALVAISWETEDLKMIWPLRNYPDVRPADFPMDLDSAAWYGDLADFIDHSSTEDTASQR